MNNEQIRRVTCRYGQIENHVDGDLPRSIYPKNDSNCKKQRFALTRKVFIWADIELLPLIKPANAQSRKRGRTLHVDLMTKIYTQILSELFHQLLCARSYMRPVSSPCLSRLVVGVLQLFKSCHGNPSLLNIGVADCHIWQITESPNVCRAFDDHSSTRAGMTGWIKFTTWRHNIASPFEGLFQAASLDSTPTASSICCASTRASSTIDSKALLMALFQR